MQHNVKIRGTGIEVSLTLDHLEVQTLNSFKKAGDVVAFLVAAGVASAAGAVVAAYLLAVKKECVKKDKGKGVKVVIRHWFAIKLYGIFPMHSVTVKTRT